ncbi:hypothetical protein ACOMHN_019569 [Nucella lapillus]
MAITTTIITSQVSPDVQCVDQGRSIRQEKLASPAVLKGSGTHRLLPDTAWRERLRDTSRHGRRPVTRGNALLDTRLPSGEVNREPVCGYSTGLLTVPPGHKAAFR